MKIASKSRARKKGKERWSMEEFQRRRRKGIPTIATFPPRQHGGDEASRADAPDRPACRRPGAGGRLPRGGGQHRERVGPHHGGGYLGAHGPG